MKSIKKQINLILELLKQKDLPESLKNTIKKELQSYYQITKTFESGLKKIQFFLEQKDDLNEKDIYNS